MERGNPNPQKAISLSFYVATCACMSCRGVMSLFGNSITRLTLLLFAGVLGLRAGNGPDWAVLFLSLNMVFLLCFFFSFGFPIFFFTPTKCLPFLPFPVIQLLELKTQSHNTIGELELQSMIGLDWSGLDWRHISVWVNEAFMWWNGVEYGRSCSCSGIQSAIKSISHPSSFIGKGWQGKNNKRRSDDICRREWMAMVCFAVLCWLAWTDGRTGYSCASHGVVYQLI